MYGLVNKAIEDLVTTGFGEDKWEEMLEVSGIEIDGFISTEQYDDQVTYALVGAAVKVLGLESEQVLVAFGEHWVLETARKGYGAMLERGGRNLSDFLRSLPGFHDRVSVVFPDLVPPRFETTDIGPGEMRIDYYSEREGLTPMVRGLLQGLGKLFDTTVSLEQLTAATGAKSSFLVRYAV